MIDKLTEKVPTNLKLSLSTLREKFGSSDNPLFGMAVNLLLASPGIAAVVFLSNPIFQFIGVVWAFINILPILSWVFGL
jgi:hypothetical protein